ncbi:thyroglobulin-like isoform X5 [Osmerus eperlanus]|uniref:thyroglobulin-like isoform X5 n=1 Tax=Osmerus eperlanus TaxID=29151 RepID=UPI002E0F8D9A
MNMMFTLCLLLCATLALGKMPPEVSTVCVPVISGPHTRCQREASVTVPGAFLSQCDPQGQYLPTQCWEATGYCWCVNAAGEEVQGTRTPPGQPRPNCAVRPLTLCEQRRASVTATVAGAYVPQCDSQGRFLPTQCWESTGQCWCVNAAGEMVPGTMTSQGQPRPNCADRPQTRCELWRASVSHLPGAYVPQCDSQGQFLPTQCQESTGQCWCVTPAGEVVSGTLTPQGQPRPNCAGLSQTSCERLRASASQVPGAYVPQCDSEGRFLPTQCRVSTGQCWCVNAAGDEVPGTLTSPGQTRPTCPVRLMTRCEFWSASVSHLPGAYVPQCDSQGQFLPTQCRVSTGQCWCVTPAGEMVSGTLTSQGQPRPNCAGSTPTLPGHPLTMCEWWRAGVSHRPGSFQPQCDSQGQFLPIQCWEATGQCWCINRAEEVVLGTLTPRGRPRPSCTGLSQTSCERLRASASQVPGAYVPQCDSEGRFLPTQCRVSTGQCWCVNAAGDEVPGTLTSPGQTRPTCPVRLLTRCEFWSASVSHLPGAYIPQCDSQGSFFPTQCWVSTGQCWCVTPAGEVVPGTVTPAGQERHSCTDRPQTLCEERRTAGATVAGAYVPQCDSQGQFLPTQCRVSTGQCWCVTPAGEMVSGTLTPQGQPRPNCAGSTPTLPGHPLTMCEWWRAGVSHLPGSFQPQCDSQGQFLPIQCWEATGQCWCINRAEEVVLGTLTPRGQPRPSCTGLSQTSCERLRASASQVPGAYVPQCDSEGRFLPTQCRVSTGQCWCVNAAGDEVPGTLTSPGQTRPTCPVRLMTRCEFWSASVSHLPGAYVPQCDSQGQFLPTQCRVSTGQCWCVTPAGEMVSGTLTPQGQPRPNCAGSTPTLPSHPLTMCEWWRAGVSHRPGSFQPQCDSQGQFLPIQCWEATGQCWCINRAEEVVLGTLTPRGQPRPSCTGLSQTSCERLRASASQVPGAYVPQCDSEGRFLPTQCRVSTGQCWCVNAAGDEVPGTLTSPGQTRPTCPVRLLTRCEFWSASVSHLPGAYIPQCDSQGSFFPTQCWVSTGQCWCVTPAGEVVPGTVTPAGQERHSCTDRPQTLCEERRTAGATVAGAYVPQCDSQGQFLPTQCWESTGQCWCVNAAGEMVPGTLTPQGQPRPSCADRPQTRCELWRASVSQLPGAYVPQCDAQGQFLPTQCRVSTGQCWCVTPAGEVVSGTLTSQGQPRPTCTGVLPPYPPTVPTLPDRPQTLCEQRRASVTVAGAYVPQCDSQGQFLPTQCWESTGQCWCVNAAGEMVPGTLTPQGQPRPSCADRPQTRCELWRASVSHLPGAYVPQCDSQGQFLPTQCRVSTGQCWCVTPAGEVVSGTLTSQGQPRPTCTGVLPPYPPTVPTLPDRPQTLCEQRRASGTVAGAYVPQCDSQGQFLPTQCQESTGQCWCVTPAGEVVSGTLTPQGQPRPNCAVSPGRPLTKCQKEASKTPLPGAYLPQCDPQGQYLPTQCWGSTGYCWCVTAAGEEVQGTRTPPGQPRPNCAVSPGRPLTKCQKEASKTPLPGAYLPQCDPQGRYLPTQCWGSTGYCWCVTAAGEEVQGTRTPPGQLGPNCAGRPLTKCQKEASETPPSGVYVPQCDPQGQYLPTQCAGGFTAPCWCVNSAGQETPGTRTFGGQRPNCAVSPGRPLTKCQKEASKTPLPGAYLPQCDPQGRYLPTQCWGSTGYCWCVTAAGEEVQGTRTPPGQLGPNCAGRPLTKCQKEASETPPSGVYVPQCDPQGQYLPTQCAGGFTAPCWCVNSAGQETPGTRTFGGQRPNCAGVCVCHPQTRCEQWRASVVAIRGVYHPQCDSQGQFLPSQCSVSTRYCWCVTPAGVAIPRTLTAPGQPRPDCSVRPQTFCEYWKSSVSPQPGAYSPQCDSEGQFLPTQCWGSTGRCWCVTAAGDGISDTETVPGQPRPNCAVVPLTFCQLWRNNMTPLPGAFIPECDSHGQFKATQCWPSYGMCWCFDPIGDIIGDPGTMTSPGNPRPTCE